MIGRRTGTPEPQAAAPTPAAAEKRPLRDADCLKPSSFASRKAEAEARRQAAAGTDRALVSMGRTSHWMKDRRGKDVYRDAELFFERGHVMRRWIKFDDEPNFYPLYDESQQRDDVEPLGTFSRRSMLPSRFQPSGPTEVRPV